MKHFHTLFLFISLLASSALNAQCENVTLENLTNPGPYEIATLTEADGIRNGPDYAGATIYYPTNGTGPFASIAMVPGFTALPSSIEEWGPFYASHGIVTIIIGTNSLVDLPEARANALLDALETIKQENTRSASPLEGALNTNQLAVSGMSMGGGGAQRAAVLDNSISAVVALCPYLNSPALNHDVPLLIFSGEEDLVAPPSEHANVHYNSTPNTTDKLLFEVANGNHFVANSPSGSEGVIGQIALSWLKLQLEEKECYCPLLTNNLLLNPPAASNVLQNFECEALGINPTEQAIGYSPNPTKNTVTFNNTEKVLFELFSPLGQSLLKNELTPENNQIDVSAFPTGIYYLRIKNKTIKLIKVD
jgi:pimeloyl-ACP methyl ester carboxylesterase